ncbi:MAG: hypothetical protein AB7E95_07150 [Kiritimatiellales bacterium]
MDLIGHALTSVTILVSVCAVLFSWQQHRTILETEQADRIRDLIALALTKLRRWQVLHALLYDELQPLFIEASRMVEEDSDVKKVRDYLWKEIKQTRFGIRQRIADEEIHTAYIGLLSYRPELRAGFSSLLETLDESEEKLFQQFLQAVQQDVLSLSPGSDYTPSDLGNALRKTTREYHREFLARASEEMRSIQDDLFNMAARSNHAILKLCTSRSSG